MRKTLIALGLGLSIAGVLYLRAASPLRMVCVSWDDGHGISTACFSGF